MTTLLFPSVSAPLELQPVIRVLDHLGSAYLVFDADGLRVHTSREMQMLLGDLRDAGPSLSQAALLTREFLRGDVTRNSLDHSRTIGSLSFRGISLHISRVLHRGQPYALVTLRPVPNEYASTSLTTWGLSPREAEVATLLAAGRNAKEVAGLLSISRHTARRHAERIYAKLGIQCRAQLVLLVTRANASDLRTA